MGEDKFEEGPGVERCALDYACKGFLKEVVEGVVEAQRRISEEMDDARLARYEKAIHDGLVEELERLPFESFTGYYRLLLDRFGDIFEYAVRANYRDKFDCFQSGVLLRLGKEFTPAGYVRELSNVLPGVDADFYSNNFILHVFGKASFSLRLISDGDVRYLELRRGDEGALATIAFMSFSVGRPEPFYEVMVDFVSHFMPFDAGDVDLAGYDEVVNKCVKVLGYKRVKVMRRHVLLAGPSGCGKSMIAKRVASLCDGYVKLCLTRGDGWQPMVRALSKMLSGCSRKVLLLVDEIDELGFSRDEEESPVYELLRLMDGVDDVGGLRILATTNRPWVLDEALLRPGRFGPPIVVAEPTLSQRREIVGYYAERLGGSVDIDAVANAPDRFSGADIRCAFEDCLIMGEEVTTKTVLRNLVALREAKATI